MNLSESLNIISEIISKIDSKEEISNLLEDLLTSSEILEISDRIMIIKLLKKGTSQRDIASNLGISLTTVSRGSRLFVFEKKAIHNYV